MIKKLKSKSGVAFVLAWIFFLLMIFLTDMAFETTKLDSTSVNSYLQNQYNYFVNKASINYYNRLFSGLQYTETGTADLPDFLNTNNGTYTKGEFSFVDIDTTATPPYAVNDSRLTDFGRMVKLEATTESNTDRGLQEAFGYFQYLRSRVIDGHVTLSDSSILDTRYLPPHQAFEVVFVMDGLPNYYDSVNDFTVTTTLTFFGASIVYDNYNSINENTARIKSVVSCDSTTLSTLYIDCIPVLDNNVWTWEAFS